MLRLQSNTLSLPHRNGAHHIEWVFVVDGVAHIAYGTLTRVAVVWQAVSHRVATRFAVLNQRAVQHVVVSTHAHMQLAQARDGTDHGVTRHDCAYACWCAGEDQVTRLQCPCGGEVFNRFRNVPNELMNVTALALLSVHMQGNFRLSDVCNLGGRRDGRDRGAVFKRFADAPRTTLLFHLVLQVASCHV